MNHMPISRQHGVKSEGMLPPERRELSLPQLIRQDYMAFMGAVFPPLIWLVFWFLSWQDGTAMSPRLVQIGAVITVLAIVVLVWRVLSFRSLFSEGREVVATIRDISFYRDRGRVRYVYTYEGQTVNASNAIMRTGRTKALHVGEEVVALVDPANPKRAVIRRLYSA